MPGVNHKIILDPIEALQYVTECNLATVSSLAHSKKTSKRELTRAINIAATGLYTLVSLARRAEEAGQFDSPFSTVRSVKLELRCKERAEEALVLAEAVGAENPAGYVEAAITAWVESIRSE